MSTNAYYHRMSEAELKQITSDKDRLKSIQFGIEGDVKEAAMRMLDLDTSWDALHFLLTGLPMPSSPEKETEDVLSIAIRGGSPVGEDYTGNGPARVLTAAQVKAIAAAVKNLEFEELIEKYSAKDLKKAQKVLCYFDDPEETMEGLEEEYFPEFKKFYLEAAKNGETVLSIFS